MILNAWISRPGGEELNSPPATEDQFLEFERGFGPIPEDFRWFLAHCGGGVVGSEWIDDIRQLPDSHRKFRAELGATRGWRMSEVFVIGWDGAGNPIAIDRTTGEVLIENHDFGGIHRLADSFERFLIEGLLGKSR